MKTNRKNRFPLFAAVAILLWAAPSQALVFNITYDASVTGSANSAQIQAAFNTAASYLQSVITNNITINISNFWGAVGPFASGISLGASSTRFTGTTTYATLTNALRNARTTANDSNAVASLPGSDPIAGNAWWYARAQAKALGVLGISPNDSINDGSIGFASDVNYTFDPTNRIVAGKYDFIGVAIHELTEVMGRVYYDLATKFVPYDLFRFSGPGIRVINNTAPTVYFSADNGTNVLHYFNPVEASGDLTDWALSGPSDCCDYSVSSGKMALVSYADLTALDIIGYKLNYQPPKLTGVRRGTNFVMTYTNLPGTTYAIVTATNLTLTLANWSVLGTNTDNGSPGQFAFTNGAPGTNVFRFYRARLN
jgi:hypothetical protein